MEEIFKKLKEIHIMRLCVLTPCYTTLDPLSINCRTLKIANMMKNHFNLLLMILMTWLSTVNLSLLKDFWIHLCSTLYIW
jgi:hypothetical protein